MKLLFAIAALLAGCASATACDGLTADAPWIRPAPPDASMRVGYVVLNNAARAPVTIEAIDSPDFGAVEIHETRVEDGMSHMHRIASLAVPPDGHLALQPGGRHLMLMRPARALKPGDTAELTLHCADGPLTISFPVKAPAEYD